MMKLDRTLTPGLSVVLLACVSVLFFVSSCTPTCDYPTIRFAKIRLVNAMPDQEQITVWLNGKIFRKNYPYDPPSDFGYFSTLADGTSIAVGTTHVVVTRDEAGTSVIDSATISVNVDEQTLIIGGRANARSSETNTKRIMLLDDQLVSQVGTASLIRFVDVLPDFPSLDVYWDSTAWRTKKPSTTLHYGVVPDYSNFLQTDTLRVT
jgi:hypothetical protein